MHYNYHIDEIKLDYAIPELLRIISLRPEQKGKEISFINGFFYKTEGYKYKVYEKARKELDFISWDRAWIGTHKILDAVLRALRAGGNLIYFTTNDFVEKAERNLTRVESLFYKLYCENDDEGVFNELTSSYSAI